MILDQLVRICCEIRLIEYEFELPLNYVDREIKSDALDHKKKREEDLAMTLYYTLKKYALGNNENGK